jgi:flagellar hook-basal body complex protein FliE
MSIEAIAAIEPGLASVVSAPRAATATTGTFNSLLSSIEQLNGQLQASDQAVQNIALGEADNLHQVMMTMERTRLEFELALQVRNKALEAYQELMRMQV